MQRNGSFWVLRSCDRGETWSKIEKITGSCPSSVLWYTGTIYVFYCRVTTRERWDICLRYSLDNGSTWNVEIEVYQGILGQQQLGVEMRADGRFILTFWKKKDGVPELWQGTTFHPEEIESWTFRVAEIS